MSAEQTGYTAGEALALFAGLTNCPPEQARHAIVIVIDEEFCAHLGHCGCHIVRDHLSELLSRIVADRAANGLS